MYALCGRALLWSVQSLRILSLAVAPPCFATAFNTHSHILYFHLLWYAILLMLYHSLSKFHRVVLLLQTCSTSEFVHDHACFCVYVYF
jgi:hypothetical protein